MIKRACPIPLRATDEERSLSSEEASLCRAHSPSGGSSPMNRTLNPEPHRWLPHKLLPPKGRPERRFRAILSAILGQSGDSVRDCRKSEPLGKPERRFRAILSAVPGQNGDSVRDCRQSEPLGRPERWFRAVLSAVPGQNGDSVRHCRQSKPLGRQCRAIQPPFDGGLGGG